MQKVLSGQIKEIMTTEKFKKEIGYGVDLATEMKALDGEIIISPRMMARVCGVFNEKIDELQKIYCRTRKIRIKNKIIKRVVKIIDKETL